MKSRRIDEIHGNGHNPANRGRTYSDNPRDPLWKISVKFPTAKPMMETIKAPTKKAAVLYAKTKYGEEASIEFLGKAVTAVR
jgi:hypothetical protein